MGRKHFHKKDLTFLKARWCIVCPTKVGYIIMTSDKAGLERKFEAKERNRKQTRCRSLRKYGWTSCPCAIESWNRSLLPKTLGWRYLAWLYPSLARRCYAKLQAFGDGREELMTDVRGTSCFVIKFGKAGEQIAKEMWEKWRQDGLRFFSQPFR